MASMARKLVQDTTTFTSTLSVDQWRERGAPNTASDLEAMIEAVGTSDLNAYVTVTADKAREQAEAALLNQKANRPLPLNGVPISVKDNYCTKGVLTTAGSNILRNFVPQYESHVTSMLWEAGAVCLGKTNMDEFGMGSSTENSCHGPTVNPWGPHLGIENLAPGGSSGGAAATIAAGLAAGAVATDTGGSIRQPAAFCGVVGMKPTYGLCSRWGIMAYGSSLDQAGVIAQNTKDAAILLDVISAPDSRDSTCMQGIRVSLEDSLGVKRPLRIGIPRKFRDMSNNSDMEAVWEKLVDTAKQLGVAVCYVDIPDINHALPCYYIIALSEASSNLARYDGVRYGHRSKKQKNIIEMYEETRSEGFGTETKRRIMTGTFALSAGYYDQYYNKARKVRALLASQFSDALETVDILAWPTAPTPAFQFGSHSADPISMYLEDVFTVPVNLVGAPAISFPILNTQSGLPMGIQFIGRQLGDATVLQAANLFEEAFAFRPLRER